MATIVTYNEATTLDIEANTTVDGTVDGSGNLILERRNSTTFNAGSVGAPTGDQGPERPIEPGRISLYGGNTAPQGWAFCDGSPVSRVNFPTLFALIGTQYGAGDGTTTFNLPNLKGRVLAGLDATQTEFDTLGEQGGSKTHTLTTAELPSHTHTVLGYASKDDMNFTGNTDRMNAADTATPVFDKQTAATGGGAAHNNLQPYYVVRYVISLGIAGFAAGGIAAPRYNTALERGTTSARDTKYGVPATDAARVALANQNVTWYNTDLGWEESYYAVTGLAGLTALGLVTGVPSGWFPTGRRGAPSIKLDATAQITVNWNQLISSFGNMRRKGGAAWFTTTGGNLAQILKYGRYDIRSWTTIGVGSGSPDFFLQVVAADGTTVLNGCSGGSFNLNASFWSRPHQEILDLIIAPNSQVGWKLQQGTMTGTGLTIHLGNSSVAPQGSLDITYVGPPLVTD